MNKEERATRRAEMQKCLDIAADVWSLMSDEIDKGSKDVHIDKVLAVIRIRFDVPLHDSRIQAVGYAVAAAINQYNLTSCGLWSLAHQLDHRLFEDDLSEINAALATLRG